MNKIDVFIKSLKSSPLYENDVISILSTWKAHLQQSHNVVKDTFHKVRNDTNEVVDVLDLIEVQPPNNGEEVFMKILNFFVHFFY